MSSADPAADLGHAAGRRGLVLAMAGAALTGPATPWLGRIGGPIGIDAGQRQALMAGDIVFREGTEFVSGMVRAADDGHAGWSHVGMLAGTPGDWQVVHAVPAEKPGRRDSVVLDSLDFFLDRALARSVGFFRVQAAAMQRVAAHAHALKQLGRPFVVQEQGGPAAGTYCTALIREAYAAAGVDLQAAPTRLALPLMAGDYLLPSALSASPKLRRLLVLPEGARPRSA